MKPKKETKLVGGHIIAVKQEDRNGVQIGIVEGLLAAWSLDRGDMFGTRDQFKKGAFIESILSHIQRRRQVRMLYQHDDLIGGFPVEFLRENEEGLYAVGEINLNVQEGREAYALAKQGVLTDFSVGFSVDEFTMDGDVRTITKATLWEASLVQEPCNPDAVVQQVKDSEGNDVDYFNTEAIKDWTERDAEKALREGAKFSKNAAKALLSILPKAAEAVAAELAEQEKKEAEQKSLDEAVAELNSFAESMRA